MIQNMIWKSESQNILTVDTDYMTFKPFLQNISKYKLDDLLKICQDEGINPIKDVMEKEN